MCRKIIQDQATCICPVLAGQPSALDVTIMSPLQASLISDAARTCGFALTLAEDRKIGHYYQKCSDMDIHFIPLALETSGGLSETTRKTLKRIALMSDKRFPALRPISSLQSPRLSGINKCHAWLSYNADCKRFAIMSQNWWWLSHPIVPLCPMRGSR